MLLPKDSQRIIQYFLFSILTLSPQCFAAIKTELNEDNQAGHSLKSFRRLLYSWDDDDSYRKSSSSDDKMTVFLIIFYVIVFTVIAILQCCKKFCNELGDDYADAIVHPPPRSSRTVHAPPNRFRRNNRRSGLNPPRTSTAIILPHGATAVTLDFTGIENPTDGPSLGISSASNMYKTANPTPLLDIPPPYEAVVRENNPSTSSERRFPFHFIDLKNRKHFSFLVQRWGDDDDGIIYYFSTTRRPYPWERPRPQIEPPTSEPPSSSGEEVVFFFILGVGLIAFLVVVTCCKMGATEALSNSSTSRTTVHPPPRNNIQVSGTRHTNVGDDIRITLAYVNSAYRSGGARNEVDSSSDRPPDYSQVTLQGFNNPAYPTVVNKPQETPPPNYEDRPVFI
ncbi:uncharacterized protein TNIN_473791 [Trichonephila inaurata madagascariensis]|uniref:Uncharacterized protein n=1 Tax=Trichonephila inaurata madagascariensis TaxID=2747483 RepID=A0A8X6XSN3_9ARAC|nr:uncharacterized protein TNIN_473791 [Trichonephila inaurata madagascariensis]